MQTFGARNKVEIFRDIYAELKGIMCANVGDTDYVMKAFNTFSKAVDSYNLSQSATKRYCFEIASALYFTYMSDSGEVGSGKLDTLSRSLISSNREEACEVTKMFISQLLGRGEENIHDIVTKAKHYIEEHLTEDLSVSDIVANLYITPNYFSLALKKHTGKSPTKYREDIQNHL